MWGQARAAMVLRDVGNFVLLGAKSAPCRIGVGAPSRVGAGSRRYEPSPVCSLPDWGRGPEPSGSRRGRAAAMNK